MIITTNIKKYLNPELRVIPYARLWNSKDQIAVKNTFSKITRRKESSLYIRGAIEKNHTTVRTKSAMFAAAG
jgi:hypothetical protein